MKTVAENPIRLSVRMNALGCSEAETESATLPVIPQEMRDFKPVESVSDLNLVRATDNEAGSLIRLSVRYFTKTFLIIAALTLAAIERFQRVQLENKMSDLKKQEQELGSVIGTVKGNLAAAKLRVSEIIASLKETNAANDSVDLTDDIANLESVADGLASFGQEEPATTPIGSTGVDGSTGGETTTGTVSGTDISTGDSTTATDAATTSDAASAETTPADANGTAVEGSGATA